jgi:hypothetical protein
MGTVQLALIAGNPHSQLYIEELPGGLLAVMVGMHRIEVVPPEGVLYRMAVGRLANAGWPVTVLAESLGHDTRTIRGWAEALLCEDAEQMLRRLSGRGARGRVTEAMVEFVLDWWEELCGRVRNFRQRILAKVEQVFKEKVSWEALRPALLQRRKARVQDAAVAARAGRPCDEESAAGGRGDAPSAAVPEGGDARVGVVAVAGSAACMVELAACPTTAAGEEPPPCPGGASAAMAETGSGLAGAETLVTGCAPQDVGEAATAGQTQVLAGLRTDEPATRVETAVVASAVMAETGSGLAGAESSVAGCAPQGVGEAATAGQTQVLAGLRTDEPATRVETAAVASAVMAETGSGLAGAESSVAGCAPQGVGEAATADQAQVPTGRRAPVVSLIPNGGAIPAAAPALVHHAGQVLAAKWLEVAGATGAAAEGMVLSWCAQLLQGAVNIEQVRDVSDEDLARFTGVGVCRARTQRERLGRLSREPALWLELLRGNAELLPDGPGHGSVFYYDPHTKEYTGGLPFLRGWCGRRHGVAKVLHLDFFHTRAGHPCFVFPADNYYDLRERIFVELELFDGLFPARARTGRTLVIDRGIFGIDTFADFTRRRDWLITWEKGYKVDGWQDGAPVTEFVLTRPRNHSRDLRRWTFRLQEQPWQRDASWRRLVVRATTPEGRTTEAAVLCSNPHLPATEVTELIFSRWLQENDFRTLDRHFGIMQLTSRRSQAYAELADTLQDRPIESIEYRELRQAAADLRKTQAKLLYDRERVSDALAELDRDSAGAAARIRAELPVLEERFTRCRAAPEPSLEELVALGAWAAKLTACRKAVQQAARGRPKIEQRRAWLQASIDSGKAQLADLERRMRTACSDDSKLRFLAAEGHCRPDTAAKHTMDCVKILARNVFYCLLRDFRRHYDNRRDDLAVLRLVLRAAGRLHMEDGILHVGLWLRASLDPAVLAAVSAFLASMSEQINDHFQGRAVPVQVRLLPSAPEV